MLSQRSFRQIPLEQLPENTPFHQRVNYRLSYYIQNDLPWILSGKGEKRADHYLGQFHDFVVASRRKQTALGRPTDNFIVGKVFLDATAAYGEGVLDTSLKMRMHLIEALCEHLGVDIEAMEEAMENEKYSLYSQDGYHSASDVNNRLIEIARERILIGLKSKRYIGQVEGPVQLTDAERAVLVQQKDEGHVSVKVKGLTPPMTEDGLIAEPRIYTLLRNTVNKYILKYQCDKSRIDGVARAKEYGMSLMRFKDYGDNEQHIGRLITKVYVDCSDDTRHGALGTSLEFHNMLVDTLLEYFSYSEVELKMVAKAREDIARMTRRVKNEIEPRKAKLIAARDEALKEIESRDDDQDEKDRQVKLVRKQVAAQLDLIEEPLRKAVSPRVAEIVKFEERKREQLQLERKSYERMAMESVAKTIQYSGGYAASGAMVPLELQRILMQKIKEKMHARGIPTRVVAVTPERLDIGIKAMVERARVKAEREAAERRVQADGAVEMVKLNQNRGL